MKKIMFGCALGLLSCSVPAQDEPVPADDAGAPAPEVAAAEPAGNAWTALQGRDYLSPALSWVFADSGRQTDQGPAVSLAYGHPFTESLVLEGFIQHTWLDHEQGSGTAKLLGLGINSLFFPTKKAPAYLLLGGGYGDVSSHPGGETRYGTLLLNVGGGYWWKPFDLLFLRGVSLRTDAVYRLDAHNDRRTGTTVGNGRKDFGDILLSVGLNIPIGEAAPAVPAPAAEPVEVVPAVSPPDSDGDGVADELDQCPETPAGTAVDENGCPVATAAPASSCKAPEPGEKLDLAGCGTGDVIVLKGVNFEFNKDRLTVNARTILDGVGESLKASPSTNVELGGHTDSKGSDEYNQRLSQRRACAAASYLTTQGVEAGRMTPSGYGESRPVADNDSDEGREQNRRVELKILDGAGSGLETCAAGGQSAATAPATAPPEPVTPPEPVAGEQEAPSPAATEASAPSAPPDPATLQPAEPSYAPPPPAEIAPSSSGSSAPAPDPAAQTPMQMVPEGDVFGSGSTAPAPAPTADAAQPDVGTMQMVPEGEVFGGGG